MIRMLSPVALQHTYGCAVGSCSINDNFPINEETFLSSSKTADFGTTVPMALDTDKLPFWLLLIIEIL
jgi:hypothetical protein